MRWALPGAALAGVFLLMIGSVEPADWALAGAAAAAAAWAAAPRRDGAAPLARLRPGVLPRFALGVGASFVRGVARTLRALLAPAPRPAAGLVEIPLGGRSQVGAAVDGLVISAAPGAVVIDQGQGRMLLHTLEVAEPEQIRRDIDRFYERYQKSLLP